MKGRGASDQYIVFPGHYCSCHSFFWDVVSRKHAIYVSRCLGLLQLAHMTTGQH